VETSTRNLGRSLSEARFRRWLELAEIEAELELPAAHLRALESGAFYLLPGPEYAISTLRAYADYLGLDSEPYVDAYKSLLAGAEAAKRIRRRRMIFGVPAILAFVGLVAATGFGRSSFDDQKQARGSGRQPAPPATTSSRTEATAPSTEASPPQPSEEKLGHSVSKPEGEPPRRVTHVELAASRGDCWLSVRMGSPTGRLLYQGELRLGRSLDFTGKRLWIRFGAASNVDLTVNGNPLKEFAVGTVDAFVTARGFRLETPIAGGA
jgi:hypothetical protein